MRVTRCHICGKQVPPRAVNRSYPFCSDRCRLVDLGKWLGEEYRVPGPPAGEGAEAPARSGESEEDDP